MTDLKRRDDDATSRLIDGLGVESLVPERLEALSRGLNFRPGDIAEAVGVTVEALRGWASGTKPRRDAANALDDLRCAAATLLEGGVPPERVEPWFTSKPRRGLPRPIDLIRSDPESVLAAAEAHVNAVSATEADILAAATRGGAPAEAPPVEEGRPGGGDRAPAKGGNRRR